MQAADRIITAAEMAEVDRRAQEEFGIPGMLLMENAGQKAWAIVREKVRGDGGDQVPPRIAFIAGGGNNGGDALVMARQALIEDYAHVLVVTVSEQLKGLALTHWEILERLGARRLVWNEDRDVVREALQDVEWIVDGISGTGLSGALRESAGGLVEAINGSPAPVVAVDVPSGLRDGRLPGEPAIKAHMTIVTGYLKTMLFDGENRALVGDIRQVDPGFPATLVNNPQVVVSRIRCLPRDPNHPVPVDPDTHKGRKGRVLIVGGSPGTAGAAVLSAEGARAAGVGIVQIRTSRQGVDAALARNPSFMAGEFPAAGDQDQWQTSLDWAHVAVLGPGWTTLTDADLAAGLSLCDELNTAVILDASALRVLAQRGAAWEQLQRGTVPVTLTPHLGEWRALSHGEGHPHGLRTELERFPQRPGMTVVVKSSVTWVRHDGGEIDVLDGRTAALAVAGSGDVLSGVLAGAVARVTAAGRDTPEAIRDALRWGLVRHLEAGQALQESGASPSAADLAARIGGGAGAQNG